MVAKGLSWALRAHPTRNRQVVVDVLHRFDETIAPRMRREVCNKLESGLNPNPPKDGV